MKDEELVLKKQIVAKAKNKKSAKMLPETRTLMPQVTGVSMPVQTYEGVELIEVCSLPAAKVSKSVSLVMMLKGLLASDDAVISVRALAKVIGNVTATLEGVEAARIMVMGLQTLEAYLTQQPAWDWD